MLIVMKNSATEEEVQAVCTRIQDLGFEARPMPGALRTAIGVVGNDRPVDGGRFHGLPGVRDVIPVSAPYKQVSREWQPESTLIHMNNGVVVGGPGIVVMGGPCSVESEDQLMKAAHIVAEAGGTFLRGGAFKPRSSPYAFQGMGEEGLQLLRKAADKYGLAVITEAMDADQARLVAQYADVVQIGARNMQNFSLLKVLGGLGKPVMLKRGMSATVKEWLLAAEYIMAHGNPNIMLCARGIRGFDSATRNVLDVGSIALVKTLTHLPVIADPSHATGRRELVVPAARASVAVGADGVIVETHPNPAQALSDGQQALYAEQFAAMVPQLEKIGDAIGRPLAQVQQASLQ